MSHVLTVHISRYLDIYPEHYYLNEVVPTIFEYKNLNGYEAAADDVHSVHLPDQTIQEAKATLWIVHFADEEITQQLVGTNIAELNAKNYYWIGYSSAAGAKEPENYPKDPHFFWVANFLKIRTGLKALLEDWEKRLASDSKATPEFSFLEKRSRYWIYKLSSPLEALALQDQVVIENSIRQEITTVMEKLKQESQTIGEELDKILSPALQKSCTGKEISDLLKQIKAILSTMDT